MSKTQTIVLCVSVAIVLIAAAVLLLLYFTGVLRFAEPAKSTGGKYLFCFPDGLKRIAVLP